MKQKGRELAVWSKGSEATKAHLHTGMSQCHFSWTVLEKRWPYSSFLAFMVAVTFVHRLFKNVGITLAAVKLFHSVWPEQPTF